MVELPDEKWPELMPALLQFAQDQDNVQLRVSTLVTLGFICETIVGLLPACRRSELMAEPRNPRSSIERDPYCGRLWSQEGRDESSSSGSRHHSLVQCFGIHQGQL